jgi:hypothetical protein
MIQEMNVVALITAFVILFLILFPFYLDYVLNLRETRRGWRRGDVRSKGTPTPATVDNFQADKKQLIDFLETAKRLLSYFSNRMPDDVRSRFVSVFENEIASRLDQSIREIETISTARHQIWLPQQNLWGDSGSGSRPKL